MSSDTQLGLFFSHPGARTTDHDSSHRAMDAHEASGNAARQRDLVLAGLRRWPGATSRQLAQLSGIPVHVTGRRLPELARAGLIERVAVPGEQITWFPL